MSECNNLGSSSDCDKPRLFGNDFLKATTLGDEGILNRLPAELFPLTTGLLVKLDLAEWLKSSNNGDFELRQCLYLLPAGNPKSLHKESGLTEVLPVAKYGRSSGWWSNRIGLSLGNLMPSRPRSIAVKRSKNSSYFLNSNSFGVSIVSLYFTQQRT